MADNPYPVFGADGRAVQTPPRNKGGGGGSGVGLGGAVLIVLVGMAALFFVAVKIATCGEDREHEAAETAQRQARADEVACGGDPWGSKCPPAARERLSKKQGEGECRDGAKRREAWLGAPSSEMEEHSPATFQITAVGACSTTMRVHETDCSIGHLVEAYGAKPFMLTARTLGFRKLSCRYDEFDLSTIISNGR